VVLSSRQNLDQLLLRVVDGGLAGVIFVAPLLMGGRHAAGQLALTVLAVTAAWVWAVRQSLRSEAKWRPTAATPLILLALALVVLQTVPLSPWLLGRLSPAAAHILPLWKGESQTPASFGCWNCISFTPAETLAGLVIFLDFVLLFLVAAQRVRHIENVERLLRWCALSAVVMASFGIVQLLAGNGKFLWFYEHPFSNTYGAAKGSFSNRNHFAHFLALGVGPLLWCLQDALRRTHGRTGRRARTDIYVYLWGLGLGVVLFAGLLSLSRGGIAAMFLALAICTAVCYRTTSLGRRFVAALAGSTVLIGVSLAIFGLDRVSNRMEDLSTTSRTTIWSTTAKAAGQHLLLGTGVGSFAEVYPAYADAASDDGREPTHAESGYLQVLLETGVAGFALLLSGIAICGSWCIRSVMASVPTRAKVCSGAIAGSLGASAAHSLVDFVWYVPACMAIVAILAACAMRVWQMASEDGKEKVEQRGRDPNFDLRIPNCRSPLASLQRFFWPATAAALTLVGAWMIADRIGPAVAQTHWDEYLVALHAAEAETTTDAGRALTDAKTQERWIAGLESVVRWQPTHIQAHLKLVETHRRLFDILQNESANPMSVIQLSDAVFNEPQFQSRAALAAWLPQAVGPHWVQLERCLHHVKKALALSPLEGRGYIHVAQLSFLWTSDRAAERACVEQAMCVRPFDGEVLYAAGNQALLSGNETLWREYLKRAFHCGRPLQQRIMADRVAGAAPECLPAVIADVLREFRPDLENAAFLHNLCATRCPAEQLTPLLQYRADVAEAEAAALQSSEAAVVWLQAHYLYCQLHNDADALRCARNALQWAPGKPEVHYHLGMCLLRQSQFAEAELHLRWCLQRAPNDKNLESNTREALRGRIDEQRRAASKVGESVSR
jgi:O-antigen ligase/tetratricopeptide (TPR) repeat protein